MEPFEQFNPADHYDLIALLLAAEEEPALRERPEYENALARVQGDESLREWFEQERDYYTRHRALLSGARLSDVSRERISRALESFRGAVAVPAESSASTFAASSSVGEPAPVAAPITDLVAEEASGRRSFLRLALPIAALLVVGLGLATFLSGGGGLPGPQPTTDFERFQHFAASKVADHSFRLKSNSPTVEEAIEWLRGQSAPGVDSPPGGTTAMSLPTAGCTLLEWNGHPVSLICMKSDGHRPMVHLFAIDQDAVAIAPTDGVLAGTHPPRQWHQRPTRSWVDGKTAYVLVGHKKTDTLQIPEAFELPEVFEASESGA